MADDRKTSHQEIARQRRREAYRKEKERRATDPRHLALKQRLKEQRRVAYQAAKERRRESAPASRAQRRESVPAARVQRREPTPAREERRTLAPPPADGGYVRPPRETLH